MDSRELILMGGIALGAAMYAAMGFYSWWRMKKEKLEADRQANEKPKLV